MSNTTKIVLGIFLALFIGIGAIAVVGVSTYLSLDTKELNLRNQIKQKQEANKAVYDNTWKTIQQVAGVANQYRNGFDSVYKHLMDSRYQKGDGSLLKFIKESNPTFDPSLYVRLDNTIEANRSEFTENQKELLDLKREHDNILDTWPGRWFLSGRQKIDVTIITSTRTDKSFTTGKDDDVSLPGDKK